MNSHRHGYRPSEMQGQLSQPTELPARNSAVLTSYESARPSVTYEHKGLSATGSSPPASSGSPVQSLPSRSPRSMSTNTVPAALFDTRLGSPVYQHPAHQPLGAQEYFPPPPARTDTRLGPTLVRPSPVHGRSHELPASTSPALAPRNVGHRSAENMESTSRRTYSFTS